MFHRIDAWTVFKAGLRRLVDKIETTVADDIELIYPIEAIVVDCEDEITARSHRVVLF
jgi:hypothetical protein